jgi:hypothetical protein
LRLKTLISVVPDAPLADLSAFCRDQGIEHVPFAAEKYREEGVTVTQQQVAQV